MKLKLKVAIIVGTGCEDLPLAKNFKKKTIFTKYGLVNVKQGEINNSIVFFLPRHTPSYKAPHQINALANLAALKREKVDYILATAACGTLDKKIKPGDFVILSDFIDFTRARMETFNPSGKPSFIDLSEPYDNELNKKIHKAARSLKIGIHQNITYVCTEGPRFETKAEIKAFRILGAQVVGMTQIPEVILARESNIPYAALGIATNYAAGMQRRISEQEVRAVMAKKSEIVSRIFLQVIGSHKI